MKARRPELLIVLAGLLLFVPGLGAVHLFDWDEINFAEIGREMIVSGDYFRPQVDFEPFWEKPPLFMWMQVACMKAFGVGEFAARLPNALCGIVTLLVLFRIGSRLRDRTFGWLWVLAYTGSILPHLYFRSGIIDPWFNLFIFLSLHAWILLGWGRDDRPTGWPGAGTARYALLLGAFLGLGMLTKGPVALLILGLTAGVHWIMQRFRIPIRLAHALIGLLTMVAVSFLWFGTDWLMNGSWFLDTFVKYQIRLFSTPDAGHGGFPGYHVAVLLLGCFPASLFAIQEWLAPGEASAEQRDYRRWMSILFFVVLILFSIVKSKIVHYSSMCYFPLTHLAAVRMHRIWSRREGFGWTRFAVGALGTLIAVVVIALPFVALHPEAVRPLLAADPFAQGNLDAAVHWSGLEASAGAWLLLALVAAHVFHSRGRPRESLVAVFGGTALFVTFTLYFFINNIEAYSQRAAIRFFEGHAGERCWVATWNYRSYAPWFYARTTEAVPANEVLATGPIDRPVHLSCKVTAEEEVRALGTFHETGRANGFVFWRRDPEPRSGPWN